MVLLEGSFLTNEGIRLCSQTGANSLTFTRAVTGSGTYQASENVKEMTALKSQKQQFGIVSKTVDPNTYVVDVIFQLKNQGLLTAYDLSEIGLYAKGDDNVEVLYCVAYALPENVETMPAESSGIEYFSRCDIQTKVSAEADVMIQFDVTDHEWVASYVQQQLDPIEEEIAEKNEHIGLYIKNGKICQKIFINE